MEVILLFSVAGAIPALIASFFGGLRRVNLAGGVTLAILIGVMVFSPSEPHPYLGVLAVMMMPGAAIGWLVGASVTYWRNTKQRVQT